MESGFGDFITQVPPGPIIMFCASGLLMVVVLVLIVRARAQKAQAQQTVPASTFTPTASPVMSDLPDLDLLVTTPPPQPIAAPRQARKGTHAVALSDGTSTDAVEVMTIMRDVVEGGLIVQIGDKAYRSVSNDDAVKANFMKVMRELATLVKTSTQTAQAVKDEEPVVKMPAPETQAPAGEVPASLRDLLTTNEPDSEVVPAPVKPKAASIPPPPSSPRGDMPGDLPKYKLDDKPVAPKKGGGIFRRGKLELEPVPELNIAGAIEAYLQHKLKYTPEYDGRSIHVHPAPDGGVAIEVDGRFYEAVSDVAEEDVRTFLAATIQEWQQRN
jgi:hypothetical protein